MNRRNKKINQVFEGFRRGITTGMDLPQNFLSLMGPQQRKKAPHNLDGGGGDGGGGGGGGGRGGEEDGRAKKWPKIPTPPDHRSDMTKPKPDQWSSPTSVANPLAKFFSNNEVGKANKERWDGILFKHHIKDRGTGDFGQTTLCRDFHVAGFCPLGNACQRNHRSRTGFLSGRDKDMRERAANMDALAIATFQ